jgi:hypothetical protein
MDKIIRRRGRRSTITTGLFTMGLAFISYGLTSNISTKNSWYIVLSMMSRLC